MDAAKTLREVAPSRKRARFIAEAVERELRRVTGYHTRRTCYSVAIGKH